MIIDSFVTTAGSGANDGISAPDVLRPQDPFGSPETSYRCRPNIVVYEAGDERETIISEPRGGSLAEFALGNRHMVAERHADCIRRLARASSEIHRPELARQLDEIAGCLDRMASEIVSSKHGTEILARSGRLIPMVERLVEKRRKIMVLH